MLASTRPPLGVRRSVTLPSPVTDSVTPTITTAANPTRRSMVAAGSNPEVETLFTHPSVRIVSFMTSSGATSWASPYQGATTEEAAGTLPWTSSLERLIDVGPITIYRGPGGVAFLNSRKVMHPILPKSQCWCVDDGARKFVLQIRKPHYWRIELPAPESGDQGQSDHLKDIFSQILLFEKTPCPFRRSFTVELPEAPVTPVKKRPWKPVQTPKSEPNTGHFLEGMSEPESGEHNSDPSEESRRLGEMDSDSDTTDDTNVTPRNIFPQSMFQPLIEEAAESAASLVIPRTGRSVTALLPLKIITMPSSMVSRESSPQGRDLGAESASSEYSSSVESFHTVQSWHSPITPLPLSPPESDLASPETYPYPHENISLPKRPFHSRETSEITVTPESPRVWEMTRSSRASSIKSRNDECITPPPKTPTLVDDIGDNLDEEHFEIATPPAACERIRHRPTTGSNSRRRTLSPLPPAANIFPPKRRPRHLQTARHLPTAIIQKTCEIFLSPPSHLLQLMLDIAAKITAGEWRGMVFGYGEGGEKVIGQWDFADDELIADEWDEDDYGVSLTGNQVTKSNPVRERVGRSWEID